MSTHEAMEAYQSVCKMSPSVCSNLKIFFQKAHDLLNVTGFEALTQAGKGFQVPDFLPRQFCQDLINKFGAMVKSRVYNVNLTYLPSF